jgi:prepilin-type processing-associated H-X9-DG protein
MIAFGDSYEPIWRLSPDADYYKSSSYRFKLHGMFPVPDFVSRRHSGGANMLFCDGHVEYSNWRKWVVQTPENLMRWNHDRKPRKVQIPFNLDDPKWTTYLYAEPK